MQRDPWLTPFEKSLPKRRLTPGCGYNRASPIRLTQLPRAQSCRLLPRRNDDAMREPYDYPDAAE